jgi:tetratricopeptide (TPR) repeat protein
MGPTRTKWLSAVLPACLVLGAALHGAAPQEKAPPYLRLLHAEDARQAKEIAGQVGKLARQGRFREAAKEARRLLELRRRVQGEDHWEVVDAQEEVAELECKARLSFLERWKLGQVPRMLNEAGKLSGRGKLSEALPLYRKALATCDQVLGEHLTTAWRYNNVAFDLDEQGLYTQAQPLHEKALAICRKVLGEANPKTATSRTNLATNLRAQGRYAAAQRQYEQALATFRQVFGEAHPDTAVSYNNLASNLHDQGRYAQAQPLLEKALSIKRAVLEADDPGTAKGYNNLAANLDAQGKHAQAQPLYEKALAIRRKAFREGHADTAESYNNLAYNLNAQGKYAAAQPLYEKALAIFGKVLREGHPEIARICNNVASNLDAQGKYAAAQPLYRKALAIFDKEGGREHPLAAEVSNNLAANLEHQGNYPEAQRLYQEALASNRRVLGEEHPHTITSCNNLAFNLHDQGQYARAEKLLMRSVPHYLRIRQNVTRSGLDRARMGTTHSPLDLLTALLARRGQAGEAWAHLEQGLARATLDELATRLRYTPQEQERLQQLAHRLRRLDQLLEHCPATPRGNQQRKELLTRQRQVLDEQDAFCRTLDRQYGALSGQVFSQAAIQKALPADAALLAWLDLPDVPKAADPRGDHWAVLLRARGQPAWVRIMGSGPRGARTEADADLPRKLRRALQSNARGWQELATRLRRQRLEPLHPRLEAGKDLPVVRRLIVLPSPALAGVPVEVLAQGYTVSYALSGTLYAHLRQLPRPGGREALLLADPVFQREQPPKRRPKLPPHGLLVRHVLPGSSAARALIQPGDVLLRYAGVELKTTRDLDRQIEAHVGARKRPLLLVWRDGKERLREVAPGDLGVVLARQPAPAELARRYEDDQMLVGVKRGKTYPALPGTRVEVLGLRRLFKDGGATLLLGSEASEQKLDELARKDLLKRYRFLHLATHGEANWHVPLQSEIILAQDRLTRDVGRQLERGLPVYDGRLTAEEVLRTWQLSSELVTLSACETGLGRHERGEGYLGFAQAMLLSGSRSVCLSLWQVDDTATALLMERFYQNLLGKRSGLKKPLGKAEALSEAKKWLRELTQEEAVRRYAALLGGVPRGQDNRSRGLRLSWKKGKSRSRPFAHSYYWAAFVLIGHDG